MAFPRIVIINPYFGSWPFWIDFYLESIRWNPSIDWRFYTDCGCPDNAPPNATFIECSFKDYQDKVGRALDISFNPDSAYKLCDIKPAYGYIHAAEIVGYDLWGFADIDIVYGDLMGFLSAEMLKHNMISFHGRRVSGHLTLMSNTRLAREAFMQVAGWREVFELRAHTFFDEKHFSKVFMRHKDWPRWLRRAVYSRNPYMSTAHFSEAYSTSFGRVPWEDGGFDYPRRWAWRDGQLSCDRTSELSFPYLHFLYWKQRWSGRGASELVHGDVGDIGKGFSITEDGFFVP